MEVKEGYGVGLTEKQKETFFSLCTKSISQFGGPKNHDEENYTKRAFFVGKEMIKAFGGVWACVCGRCRNGELDFSFTIGAVRFASCIIEKEFFFYCGQIYDPLAPLYTANKDEWNLL